jgi:hypothetical protein
MLGLVLSSYLMTLPGAQKCFGKRASRKALLPLDQALQDIGCILRNHRGLHGAGLACVIGTTRRHPLGDTIDIAEAPTECLDGPTNHKELSTCYVMAVPRMLISC